jgi:hypothetical protein
MFPGVINRALSGCMKAGGLDTRMRSTAALASALGSPALSGTMSSNTTGTPALARWLAMPEPMVPAPITAAFLMPAITKRGQIYFFGRER